MKKLVLFFILIANLCHGQLQNTWMLGHFLNPIYPKCGIDFSYGTADTFSFFREMPFFATNTIISDSTGQVLFYTNGEYIANRNHDTLLNSKNFNPGYATTQNAGTGLNVQQGVVFLPFESWNSKYTVIHCSLEEFTLNNNYYNRPFNLKYSIVDMNLDNGMGGIVQGQKDVTILNDTLGYGKITGCRHANGRDWWVLSRKFQTNKVYTFLITPDTIIGSSQNIGSAPLYDVRGQAEFSPDGNKYAILTQNHLLDLFDFDRCMGLLSNPMSLTFPDTNYAFMGLSFSPNSRYLYANTQLAIYQFDLWSSNIDSSLQTVALWDTVASPFATFFCLNQMAVDGKVYISTNNGCDVLHCIESPDSLGIACNILQNSIKLPSRNSHITNYPNYGLGALTGSPCDTLTGVNNTNTNTNHLNMFPNPATNYVNITYQFKTNEQAMFTLYNSMGQEVVRKTLYGTFKSLLLHTNTYNAGMYYYKVVMKNKMVETGKLVIAR